MKIKEKLFNDFVEEISTNPEYFKKSEVDLLEEVFNLAWKKALEIASKEVLIEGNFRKTFTKKSARFFVIKDFDFGIDEDSILKLI